MKKLKSIGLETIEVSKSDGTIEKTLKWRCPVCGRIWYSKGELTNKNYFSVSQIYSPSKCPCYFLSPIKKEEKKK